MKHILFAALVALGCAGADGQDGADGRDGERGPPGADGAPGSSDIIVRTVLCQADNGVSFVDAYIWVFDVAADSNDDIGMCSIGEGSFRQTSYFIGPACTLISPSNGVFTIDISANPPTLSGGLTGTMACQ